MDMTYSPGADFSDRTIRLNICIPRKTSLASLLNTPLESTVWLLKMPNRHLQPALGILFMCIRMISSLWSHICFYGSLFTPRLVTVVPDHTENTTDHTDPLPTAHYFHRPLDIQRSLDAVASYRLNTCRAVGPIRIEWCCWPQFWGTHRVVGHRSKLRPFQGRRHVRNGRWPLRRWVHVGRTTRW